MKNFHLQNFFTSKPNSSTTQKFSMPHKIPSASIKKQKIFSYRKHKRTLKIFLFCQSQKNVFVEWKGISSLGKSKFPSHDWLEMSIDISNIFFSIDCWGFCDFFQYFNYKHGKRRIQFLLPFMDMCTDLRTNLFTFSRNEYSSYNKKKTPLLCRLKVEKSNWYFIYSYIILYAMFLNLCLR